MLLNSKLHTDTREAEVNINYWLLFNDSSCSPKQKSTVLLLYKKDISVKRSSRLDVNVWLKLLEKACEITT